ILPTAGRHTESLPLANKQEFLPNRVGNKLAPVPLINQPVEIGANLLRKRNVSARCAHVWVMVYLKFDTLNCTGLRPLVKATMTTTIVTRGWPLLCVVQYRFHDRCAREGSNGELFLARDARRTKGEMCYDRRMERSDASELSRDDLE